MSAETLLSLDEAAQALRCSVALVFKLARNSKLTVHKVGARSVIKQSELDRYISSLAARPATLLER